VTLAVEAIIEVIEHNKEKNKFTVRFLQKYKEYRVQSMGKDFKYRTKNLCVAVLRSDGCDGSYRYGWSHDIVLCSHRDI
jgi:hypothetical protein